MQVRETKEELDVLAANITSKLDDLAADAMLFKEQSTGLKVQNSRLLLEVNYHFPTKTRQPSTCRILCHLFELRVVVFPLTTRDTRDHGLTLHVKHAQLGELSAMGSNSEKLQRSMRLKITDIESVKRRVRIVECLEPRV